jgi:general secretion pathway protein K
MPRRPVAWFADRRRTGGFALIIVLWTLVLIGFLVAHLTAAGRTEIRIAGNLVTNAAAQAAADGAIFEAIFSLLDPRPEQRWPANGAVQQLTIGKCLVRVRVEDEASWINPSSASPELLEALLRMIGSDAESARRVAVAISEWVGSATNPRQQEMALAEYRGAGLDYGPPGTPIETIDELGRVIGMTPAVLAAIRPHLTLFGPPEPNPATTDLVVAGALALLAPQTGSPATFRPNLTSPDVLTVRITALASGPGNARAARYAVVRTGPALPQGYTVLAWGVVADPAAVAASFGPALTR